MTADGRRRGLTGQVLFAQDVLLQQPVVTGCLADSFGPAVVNGGATPNSFAIYPDSLLIVISSLSAVWAGWPWSGPVTADGNLVSNNGRPDSTNG